VRVAVLLGIAAFLALFAVADLRELWRVVATANVPLLALSLGCAVASYAAMARSYQGIAVAAGADVGFWEMFKVTIVASTVNYLVSTGGLSGFAVRIYFFTRRGIASSTAVLISLAQTFMTNLTLLGFVLLGFAYLFRAHSLSGYPLLIAGALLVLFIAAGIVAALLLLHARLRRRTLFYLAQGTHWVMHRMLPHRTPARTHIWRYQFNLNRGIAFLVSRKREMIGPAIFILLDWVFTILILYTAFLAVHHPVRISFVIVGFAVGIVLSYVSLIPGGLGIMEGSMAAIFAGLGVPFETAVVGVLVYRVAYYVMPLVVSVFFHGMFTQGRQLGVEVQRGDRSAYGEN
jgi:uncharacterized protein (TIRG00374 family)